MKIAHISDIHIKNTQDHKKYENSFEQLRKSLAKQKPEFTVVTGDLAHSKTQISPEYVSLANKFLSLLCENSGHVIVIPGNHDGNLKNLDREDSIKPIVQSVAQVHSNITFERNSKKIEFDKINFYHLSVFDGQWPSEAEIEKDKINVALYHGCIAGAKTDIGHELEGEAGVSIFANYDYAMLGDIHKSDQKMTKDGKVRYAGSLIQQNFGEDPIKGYLLWDLKGKKSYDCNFIPVFNGEALVSISDAAKEEDIQEIISTQFYEAKSVRILASKFYNSPEIKKAVSDFKVKYKNIDSVLFKNHQISQSQRDKTEEESKAVKTEDGQEKMISTYLKTLGKSDDLIKQVLELNKEYTSDLEKDIKYHRWEVKKLSWDNVFNYGPGNSIDFNELDGIVGIFGPSFSGKSSVIDSLMLAIFESTSKNITKNREYINSEREVASMEVEIEAGDNIYKISRVLEKVGFDGSKGEVKIHIKNKAGKWAPLNLDSKKETEGMIKQMFGTREDFIMTSLSSQRGAYKFLEEKSTDRKNILSKFLDVDFFLDKHAKANKDFLDLKSNLKYLQSRQYDKCSEIELKIKDRNSSNEELLERLSQVETDLSVLAEKVNKLNENIGICGNIEVIDISKVTNDIFVNESLREECLKEIKQKEKEIKHLELIISKSNDVKNTFDIDSINRKLDQERVILENISNINKSIEEAKSELGEWDDSQGVVEKTPCGGNASCLLVERARKLIDSQTREDILTRIASQTANLSSMEKSYEEFNFKDLKEKREAYDLIVHSINVKQKELDGLELHLKNSNDKVLLYENVISTLKDKVATYYKQNELQDKKIQLEVELQNLKIEVTETNLLKKELGVQLGVVQKEINTLENELKQSKEYDEELDTMLKKYEVLDTYKQCMHSNGLPLFVIKQNLGRVNDYIATILGDIVDFEVYLDCNETKLEVMIKHPGKDARVIETGSGAEWSLAAMGIRLALMGNTSLPRPNMLILDEPATEMDPDIKQNFVKMLSNIKPWFKTIILISHIESLRDIVDKEIVIDKNNKNEAFVKSI